MKKQLLSVLLAGSFAAMALPASAQNLATVNGVAIPQARYDFFINQFEQAGQKKTPELEAHVKEELIRRAVFEQEAQKLGLEKTDAFKEEMELARQTFLIRALFQKYQKDNPVSDAAVKAEYDKYVAENKGKEYHSSHILVETEEEAKAIIADLKKDASKFEAIAKEKSKDPGSGANGGDLGWSRPEAYVPEFGEALKKLSKGKMTETPVKTQFGWHILKLKDSRDIQPPKLEDVKSQIQEALGQKQLAEFQEKLYKAAKIEK